MDTIKRKIKLSIPIVTLYQNYADEIGKVAQLNKSTIATIDNDIQAIPKIIAELKAIPKIDNADTAFNVVSINNKYDKLLVGIHNIFDQHMDAQFVASSSSSDMSDVFKNRINTMYVEMMAMYNTYSRNLLQLNMDALQSLMIHIKPLNYGDIIKLVDKYPGTELLHGQYIQSHITHGEKWEHRLITLKNSMFHDEKQQPLLTGQPPLQNMGLVQTHVAITINECAKICFGSSTCASIDDFVAIATKHKMGVIMVTHHIPGNYVYDVSNLIGAKNAQKYRQTDVSCIDSDTNIRYDTIKILKDTKDRKMKIEHLTTGVYEIIIHSISPTLYSICTSDRDIKIHHTIGERLLRGPSVRINGLQKRACNILNKFIHQPPDEIELDELDMATHIAKMDDSVTHKFVELMAEQQPGNISQLRSIVTTEEIFATIRRYLVSSIGDCCNINQGSTHPDLLISATADISNIIDNFRLSINSEYDALKINEMTFKEKGGHTLHSYLTGRITPIFRKVIDEILVGKTNIFANIQRKNNQLNFRWK
jgi:hypothetical protein